MDHTERASAEVTVEPTCCSSTATPAALLRSRARATVREAGVATKWLVAGVGVALLSLVMLAAVFAVALLRLAGVGLFLARPVLLGVRAVAGAERSRLRAIGYQIVPPYENLPATPLAAVRSFLDPAVRRDLAWLACNATFGFVVTAFGVQVPVNAVQGVTRPARRHGPPGRVTPGRPPG